MSFEYTCFYILKKLKIDSSTYGDISGPFSKTEILDLSYDLPSETSIITDINSYQHIVGIPTRNHNMISKNKLYFYMATYNIGALLSIKPYEPLGGNDTGEGSEDICIKPEEKKLLASKGSSDTASTTIAEITGLLARGHINPYRHCIFKR